MASTWPTGPQRRVLAAAPVKPDWPSQEAYARAAKALSCDVAAIKAVAEVEAGPLGAFLDTGEPVILFERHKLDEFTGGRYRGARAPGLPDAVSLLSSPRAGGYGSSKIQHRKLAAAVKLDREAALECCSWGLFQVLGRNWRRAGHKTLQSFINAAYLSADAHLDMLVAFVLSDPRLLTALREHRWADFARGYNGPAYARHGYHARIAAAHARLAEAA
jgi:hypothetical protein